MSEIYIYDSKGKYFEALDNHYHLNSSRFMRLYIFLALIIANQNKQLEKLYDSDLSFSNLTRLLNETHVKAKWAKMINVYTGSSVKNGLF